MTVLSAVVLTVLLCAGFLTACDPGSGGGPTIPTYTIGGAITTSDEAGAEGATVRFEQDGTPIGSPATAGANEIYTISGVPAGEYTIAVSFPGYEPGTITAFTVSADVTDLTAAAVDTAVIFS
jgi:hypothetical protein